MSVTVLTRPRVEHLVVARESNTDDLPMLEGMVLQTLQKYPHLPGHPTLLDLGIDPVFNPTLVNGTLRGRGGSKAVLFEVEGTACLYSRGSAASADSQGDNGFVSILCETLEDLRPRNVYVATFSRLVRSQRFASDVFRVLADHRIVLHDGTNDELRVWEQTGMLRWSIMAMFADMERHAVLMRLTLGRFGRHRKGEWVLPARLVPFGYELQDRKLVPVEAARDHVHKAIRLMGDPAVSLQEIARALSDIGVATPARGTDATWGYDVDWQWDGSPYVPEAQRPTASAPLREQPGSGRPLLADMAAPHEVVTRLVRLLDLWETGVHTIKWTNPLPDVDRYAEYHVIDRTDDYPGHILLEYKPGVVEGGWATPDEFAEARAVRLLPPRQDGRRALSRGKQKPLLGGVARWNDETHRFALLGGPGDYYRLYRQDLPEVLPTTKDGRPKPPGWWRSGRPVGEQIAVISAREIHQSLHEQVIKAFQEGAPLTPDPDAPPTCMGRGTQSRLQHLRRERDEAQRRAERARTKMLDLETDDATLAVALERDARRFTDQAEDLTQQVAALEAQADVLPNMLTFDPRTIVGVFAGLANVDGIVPRLINEAIEYVLKDLTIWADGTRVHWSCHLRLPVEDGVALFGPITGKVNQRLGDGIGWQRRDREQAAALRLRRGQAVAEQLMTTEELLRPTIDPDNYAGIEDHKRAIEYLQDLGLPRKNAALALSMVPASARLTLWELLHEHQPSHPDVNPEFAHFLHATYTTARLGRAHWLTPLSWRHQLTERLTQQGGAEPEASLRRWLLSVNAPRWAFRDFTVTTASRTTVLSGGVRRTGTSTTGTDHADGGSGAQISLRTCPHCGNYCDLSLVVPEIPTGLLCSACRRAPETESPQYPADYLTVTPEAARARLHAVAPMTRLAADRLDVSRSIRTRARLWAQAHGLQREGRTRITQDNLRRYVQAVAQGEVDDITVVREWAERQGIKVSARGPIAADVWAAFRQHIDATTARGE